MTTDAASAAASALGEYRGHQVIKTSIALTNAGDGLSKAKKIDPVVYEQGDEVLVLMRCVVGKHVFVPIADTETVELKQSFVADTATVVSGASYEKILNREQDKIDKATAAERGQGRIPGLAADAADLDPDDDDDDAS